MNLNSCVNYAHFRKSDHICEREALNPNDRYAVAVMKNDVVISHLPTVLSQICSLFIARGGAITCVVSGARKFSVDLS